MLANKFFSLIYNIRIEIMGFYFFFLLTDPRKSALRRSDKLKIAYVWPNVHSVIRFWKKCAKYSCRRPALKREQRKKKKKKANCCT